MSNATTTPNPILWVPGWAATPRTFRPLQQRLPGCEHVCVDFRDVTTSDNLLGRVKDAILENAVVIGWSMGAMLALQAAAESESVAAVVVINGTLRFASDDRAFGWPTPILRRMQKRLATDAEATVTQFVESMFVNPETARSYIEACHHGNVLAESAFDRLALIAGLDYLATTDLTASVANFTCPVLWLHGTDDRICPGAAARQSVELLPNCTLREIPAGHAPFYEQPDETAAAIKEFLHSLNPERYEAPSASVTSSRNGTDLRC